MGWSFVSLHVQKHLSKMAPVAFAKWSFYAYLLLTFQTRYFNSAKQDSHLAIVSNQLSKINLENQNSQESKSVRVIPWIPDFLNLPDKQKMVPEISGWGKFLLSLFASVLLIGHKDCSNNRRYYEIGGSKKSGLYCNFPYCREIVSSSTNNNNKNKKQQQQKHLCL